MGKVWRDNWDLQKPTDVVLLAEQGPEDGVVYGAALFLQEGIEESPVRLTTQDGEVLMLDIPPEHRKEAAMLTDIELTATEER